MKQIPFNQQGEEAILADRKTHTRRPLTAQQIFERVHHMTENEVSEYKIGETVDLVAFDDKEYFEVPYVFATAIIKDLRVEKLQDISEEDCIREGVADVCVECGNNSFNCGCLMTGFDPIESFEVEIWQPLPYKPPYDWDSNPYVWCIVFEVVEKEK